MPRGKQWIWIVGSVAALAVIAVGCAANDDVPDDRAAFRAPTRGPVVRCTNDDVIAITDALGDPARRAEDALRLIPTASRSTLTDIAADLQDIRRDLSAEDIPSCGGAVRSLMVQALTAEIEGVLLLQGGANDAAADKLDEATRINLLLPEEIRKLLP